MGQLRISKQIAIRRFFGKNSNGTFLLLHGNSVSLIEQGSLIRTMPKREIVRLIKQSDNPLILLAAPYVFTHIQETIHLKRNELLQADNQILEFSRFPKKNRILESIPIDRETALTSLSHMSDKGEKVTEMLKEQRLKVIWEPAISFLLNQYARHYDENSQVNIGFMLDQEMFRVGWKENKIRCHHLYYWSKNNSPTERSAPAMQLLDSEFPGSHSVSIHFSDYQKNDPQNSATLQSLFFNVKKKRPIKKIQKKVKTGAWIKLKKTHFKYLVVSLTCLLMAWTLNLKLQLHDLISERNQLNRTMHSLKTSSVKLEQIADKERALMKIESLVATLKRHSLNPRELMIKLEELIPKTAWIQTLSINRKALVVQILDTENSDITRILNRLAKAFGNVELDNNSSLNIENTLLRKRTFTINLNSPHDPQ